jgi:DNA repair photolyase
MMNEKAATNRECPDRGYHKPSRVQRMEGRPRPGPKGPKPSGTQEWSIRSVNCCTGCSHDCLYCYARSMAVRFHQLESGQWKDENIRWRDVRKGYKYKEGTTMFPSSHDITPNNLFACLIVLRKLLRTGNRVLIVSKPHVECIRAICRIFTAYRDQILFRFTIGSLDDEILSIWEPNAPGYEERKDALKCAFDRGYETSVSVEPMLDSDHILELVKDLLPFVTNALWIGMMNHTRSIRVGNETIAKELERIVEGQSDEKILAIYDKLKSNPKIRWKSHIKKVVGIPLAEKPGMDI